MGILPRAAVAVAADREAAARNGVVRATGVLLLRRRPGVLREGVLRDGVLRDGVMAFVGVRCVAVAVEEEADDAALVGVKEESIASGFQRFRRLLVSVY